MSFRQSTRRLVGGVAFSIAGLTILGLTGTEKVAGTSSVGVSIQVGEVIAISITGNADSETYCTNDFISCSSFGEVLPNSYASTSSLVSVYTNSANGYSLSVRASSDANLRTTGGDSISAGVLSSETGGQGMWSYKTDATGVINSWTAMTTTDTVIKGTSNFEANGSDTAVTYGLSTTDSQTSGAYATTLVYTATAPNSSNAVEPVTFSGEHATFSVNPLTVRVNGSGTVTVTPDDGYYLASFTCTNDYTNNATTGTSATAAQNITITNPGTVKTSVCTATMQAPPVPITSLVVNLGTGIYGAQIMRGSLTGTPAGTVTTNGGTVSFTSSDQLYIIPLYQSGYTLDSITANNGTVTSDTENGYGYYYYTPSAGSSNTVTLNGTLLTSETTSTTLTTMQDLATASCPSIPTAVRDSRDNAVYYVQRMIDGKCWMLENLRLDLTDESVIGGLSTSNTHVDSDSLNSLVNGGGTTTDRYARAGLTKSQWTSSSSYYAPLVNSNYKTNTVTGYGAGRNYIGVYYNFCAASAGNYCINSSGTDMGTAEYDVCPANWQMPTGGSAGEYQALATALTGTTGEISGADATAFNYYLSTLLSGITWGSGNVTQQNIYGDFWSATRSYDTGMDILYVLSGNVSFRSGNRGYGNSVRCVRQ